VRSTGAIVGGLFVLWISVALSIQEPKATVSFIGIGAVIGLAVGRSPASSCPREPLGAGASREGHAVQMRTAAAEVLDRPDHATGDPAGARTSRRPEPPWWPTIRSPVRAHASTLTMP